MSSNFGSFFSIKEFLGISNTVNSGIKKEPVKGKAYGAKHMSAKVKEATSQLEIPISSKGATPFVLGIVNERDITSKDMGKVRSALNLTQTEVAVLLGFSISTVQKIEQDDITDHRRSVKLRFFELMSLYKFLKKQISSKTMIRSILKTSLPVFNNKSAIEFSSKLSTENRIYEVSGLLRRQFG